MIGEQECQLLQQLACIGWALEETSREVIADTAEAIVRNAAQLIHNDSIQCTAHVRRLASDKGCTLQLRRMPATIALLNQLLQLSGTAFDRYYLQEMAHWHQLTIRCAQDLVAATQDTEIRKLAGQLERQAMKRLSLIARLQTQLDRRLAQQRHYVW